MIVYTLSLPLRSWPSQKREDMNEKLGGRNNRSDLLLTFELWHLCALSLMRSSTRDQAGRVNEELMRNDLGWHGCQAGQGAWTELVRVISWHFNFKGFELVAA